MIGTKTFVIMTNSGADRRFYKSHFDKIKRLEENKYSQTLVLNMELNISPLNSYDNLSSLTKAVIAATEITRKNNINTLIMTGYDANMYQILTQHAIPIWVIVSSVTRLPSYDESLRFIDYYDYQDEGASFRKILSNIVINNEEYLEAWSEYDKINKIES